MKVALAFALLIAILACSPAVAEDRPAYLSELEYEVLLELNLARSSPQHYADIMKEWRQYYDDEGRRVLPGQIPTVTKEGVAAVDEAIAFLQEQKSVRTLEVRDGMSAGAADHVADMGPRGAMGHKGKDGSRVGDRVDRYGEWWSKVGEVITYGNGSAREIVTSFIIDDGVKDRGHRSNIFDNNFYVVGVACGPHKKYRTICVITLATDYGD